MITAIIFVNQCTLQSCYTAWKSWTSVFSFYVTNIFKFVLILARKIFRYLYLICSQYIHNKHTTFSVHIDIPGTLSQAKQDERRLQRHRAKRANCYSSFLTFAVLRRNHTYTRCKTAESMSKVARLNLQGNGSRSEILRAIRYTLTCAE